MNFIQEITKYIPCNQQEEIDKEIILKYANESSNILTRENTLAHITSSGFIVNKDKDKVLMIHHNIYNSWSMTGGHADGDNNLLKVAINEAKEETGIENIVPVCKDIASIDVLAVQSHFKRDKFIPAHLHLSITYILEGDESEIYSIKEDENSDVKWINIQNIKDYSTESHMIRVYNKLVNKLLKLK